MTAILGDGSPKSSASLSTSTSHPRPAPVLRHRSCSSNPIDTPTSAVLLELVIPVELNISVAEGRPVAHLRERQLTKNEFTPLDVTSPPRLSLPYRVTERHPPLTSTWMTVSRTTCCAGFSACLSTPTCTPTSFRPFVARKHLPVAQQRRRVLPRRCCWSFARFRAVHDFDAFQST